MANPSGVNQYTKGSGAGGDFKKKFGRQPKKGEKAYTPKKGLGSAAKAFKKQFGRNPKPGEKAFGN